MKEKGARAIAGRNVRPKFDLYLMERGLAQLKTDRKMELTGGSYSEGKER